MPVIAVVNRKGGSGKSTLATHLASYCAGQGMNVMLGDADSQQSTHSWLRRREAQNLASVTKIVGWVADLKNVLRAPPGVTHVVLDTPGGLRGFDLVRVVMVADAILMPVCNSVFDRESAAACFEELRAHPRVASGRCKVAAVGMRLDARTKADEVLRQWAAGHGITYLGVLRETQTYVRCLERGLSLFDMPPAKAEADLEQWQPIIEWIKPVLQVPVRGTPAARRPTRPVLAPGSVPSQTQPAPLESVASRLKPAPAADTPDRPFGLSARLGRWFESVTLRRARSPGR